jgi:hypothetical protein
MKLRAAAALLVTFLTANALGRQTENAIVIDAKDSTPARDSDHRRRDRHCRCVRWSSAGCCAAARKHVVVCKRNDRSCSGSGYRHCPSDDDHFTGSQPSGSMSNASVSR